MSYCSRLSSSSPVFGSAAAAALQDAITPTTKMSILSNLLCQRKYNAVSNDFGEKNSWAPVFVLFFNISHHHLSQNILNTEATQIMRGTL